MVRKGCAAMWWLWPCHHFGIIVFSRIILCSCLTEMWIETGRSWWRNLLTWSAYTQSPLVIAVITHTCLIWENVLCFSLVHCFFPVFCVCWVTVSFHEQTNKRWSARASMLSWCFSFSESSFSEMDCGEAGRAGAELNKSRMHPLCLMDVLSFSCFLCFYDLFVGLRSLLDFQRLLAPSPLELVPSTLCCFQAEA